RVVVLSYYCILLLSIPPAPRSTLFPYTTLFRSNAMLKTLEEPPAHALFILATTDPQKVPITVLSRTLQFVLLSQRSIGGGQVDRSEEHTSELQSPCNIVCRLLLEKKKTVMPTAA